MSKCMLKKATAKVAELEAQLAAAKAAQEVEAKKVEAEKKKAAEAAAKKKAKAEAEKKKAEAKKKAAELKEKADAVRKSLSYISDATALQLLAISNQGKPIRTIISDIVRECYDDTFPFSDEDDTTAVCGFLTNEVTIVDRTVAEQLEDFDRLRAATNK